MDDGVCDDGDHDRYDGMYSNHTCVSVHGLSPSSGSSFFDNSKNIKEFFPLGYIGHYNSNGYLKIAEIIAKNIE